jgi:hypothetical protein
VIPTSPDSTTGIAIPREYYETRRASNARVFDMQGRYLGTGEQKISPAVRTVKKR